MKIKACPFCGNEGDTNHNIVTGANYVSCMDVYCGATGPDCGSLEGAIMAWNRRGKNEAQQKIKAGVGIFGTDKVWDQLDRFCKTTDVSSADGFMIEPDGSIYDEYHGRYLTESCEKENGDE